MPAAIHFATVAELPDAFGERADPGIYALTDGTLVAAYETFSPQLGIAFHTSSDNGLTWNLASFLPWSASPWGIRFVTLPTNIIIAPIPDWAAANAHVYRSTDKAQTWDLVASYPFVSGFGAQITCTGGAGMNRSGAVMCGWFTPVPPSQFLRSTDFGASWSPTPPTTISSAANYVAVMAAGGGGRMAAALDGAFNPPSGAVRIYVSQDYGVTWTPSAPLPDPLHGNSIEIHAITWVTKDVVMVSGLIGDPDAGQIPPVWRSTDAGANFTRLTAGDFSNYTTPQALNGMWEIHRFTRDLVGIGWGYTTATNAAPYYFSNTGGETFEVTATSDESWGGVTANISGAMCLSFDAHLMLPVVVGSTLKILRGTYTC